MRCVDRERRDPAEEAAGAVGALLDRIARGEQTIDSLPLPSGHQRVRDVYLKDVFGWPGWLGRRKVATLHLHSEAGTRLKSDGPILLGPQGTIEYGFLQVHGHIGIKISASESAEAPYQIELESIRLQNGGIYLKFRTLGEAMKKAILDTSPVFESWGDAFDAAIAQKSIERMGLKQVLGEPNSDGEYDAQGLFREFLGREAADRLLPGLKLSNLIILAGLMAKTEKGSSLQGGLRGPDLSKIKTSGFVAFSEGEDKIRIGRLTNLIDTTEGNRSNAVALGLDWVSYDNPVLRTRGYLEDLRITFDACLNPFHGDQSLKGEITWKNLMVIGPKNDGAHHTNVSVGCHATSERPNKIHFGVSRSSEGEPQITFTEPHDRSIEICSERGKVAGSILRLLVKGLIGRDYRLGVWGEGVTAAIQTREFTNALPFAEAGGAGIVRVGLRSEDLLSGNFRIDADFPAISRGEFRWLDPGDHSTRAEARIPAGSLSSLWGAFVQRHCGKLSLGFEESRGGFRAFLPVLAGGLQLIGYTTGKPLVIRSVRVDPFHPTEDSSVVIHVEAMEGDAIETRLKAPQIDFENPMFNKTFRVMKLRVTADFDLNAVFEPDDADPSFPYFMQNRARGDLVLGGFRVPIDDATLKLRRVTYRHASRRADFEGDLQIGQTAVLEDLLGDETRTLPVRIRSVEGEKVVFETRYRSPHWVVEEGGIRIPSVEGSAKAVNVTPIPKIPAAARPGFSPVTLAAPQPAAEDTPVLPLLTGSRMLAAAIAPLASIPRLEIAIPVGSGDIHFPVTREIGAAIRHGQGGDWRLQVGTDLKPGPAGRQTLTKFFIGPEVSPRAVVTLQNLSLTDESLRFVGVGILTPRDLTRGGDDLFSHAMRGEPEFPPSREPGEAYVKITSVISFFPQLVRRFLKTAFGIDESMIERHGGKITRHKPVFPLDWEAFKGLVVEALMREGGPSSEGVVRSLPVLRMADFTMPEPNGYIFDGSIHELNKAGGISILYQMKPGAVGVERRTAADPLRILGGPVLHRLELFPGPHVAEAPGKLKTVADFPQNEKPLLSLRHLSLDDPAEITWDRKGNYHYAGRFAVEGLDLKAGPAGVSLREINGRDPSLSTGNPFGASVPGLSYRYSVPRLGVSGEQAVEDLTVETRSGVVSLKAKKWIEKDLNFSWREGEFFSLDHAGFTVSDLSLQSAASADFLKGNVPVSGSSIHLDGGTVFLAGSTYRIASGHAREPRLQYESGRLSFSTPDFALALQKADSDAGRGIVFLADLMNQWLDGEVQVSRLEVPALSGGGSLNISFDPATDSLAVKADVQVTGVLDFLARFGSRHQPIRVEDFASKTGFHVEHIYEKDGKIRMEGLTLKPKNARAVIVLLGMLKIPVTPEEAGTLAGQGFSIKADAIELDLRQEGKKSIRADRISLVNGRLKSRGAEMILGSKFQNLVRYSRFQALLNGQLSIFAEQEPSGKWKVRLTVGKFDARGRLSGAVMENKTNP